MKVSKKVKKHLIELIEVFILKIGLLLSFLGTIFVTFSTDFSYSSGLSNGDQFFPFVVGTNPFLAKVGFILISAGFGADLIKDIKIRYYIIFLLTLETIIIFVS